jgi:hypothetical protein
VRRKRDDATSTVAGCGLLRIRSFGSGGIRGRAPRFHGWLFERLAGANGRWDHRCPYEDHGERREAHPDDEGVVAEPVSEDRQPGDDRGEVRRDRGDGDHPHAVADLEAPSGGVNENTAAVTMIALQGLRRPVGPSSRSPERLDRHV